MRRALSLTAGLAAGFIAFSSGAFASPDTGIFAYPPQTDNYADSEPAAAPIPRETVAYDGAYRPGTIVIDTNERRLYLILPDRQALRYGIGVGREVSLGTACRRSRARPSGPIGIRRLK